MREHGGPEVLRPEPISVGAPGPGEIRVRNRAISVNFHDIYVRTGQYHSLALPGIPGIDAAGVVEQVGAGVVGFVPGDRIAYIEPGYGAYSSVRLLGADKAFKLPRNLDDVSAATTLLRAATVAMLIDEVCTLGDGDRVLVQAAAGGVGQLLCAWARHRGAFVIGTAGSAEKAAIARSAGAHETILYRKEDVAARVRALTAGAGVDIVYDSCGQDTFKGSLEALALCGHLILFGQSSGPVAPFAPAVLAEKSLTVSRPILFHYLRTADPRTRIIGNALEAIAKRIITPVAATTLPLEEAAEAHRIVDGRATAGVLVLIPEGARP
jgi:NADPH2:quinone reductase